MIPCIVHLILEEFDNLIIDNINKKLHPIKIYIYSNKQKPDDFKYDVENTVIDKSFIITKLFNVGGIFLNNSDFIKFVDGNMNKEFVYDNECNIIMCQPKSYFVKLIIKKISKDSLINIIKMLSKDTKINKNILVINNISNFMNINTGPCSQIINCCSNNLSQKIIIKTVCEAMNIKCV